MSSVIYILLQSRQLFFSPDFSGVCAYEFDA